jgi:DedD protein
MDRALKERITGAIVLVLVAVLIVPVFLDGPAGSTENTQEVIVLPGQDTQTSAQKTIVLERDREQPVPLARSQQPTTATPANSAAASAADKLQESLPDAPATVASDMLVKAAPAKAEPTTVQPPPKPQSAPAQTAAASTTGMWAVQLGSFSSQENAERLAASLRKDGYAAFISQLKSGSQQLHRVRVGPQKDRGSAESVAAQLQKAGHKGQVVPHP